MTRKIKKRSLSESNVTDKVENKGINEAPVSLKKKKIEADSKAQNNTPSKKIKKGNQGDGNTNKKNQEKIKNENNVKQNEEKQGEKKQTSQEGTLSRKDKKKLRKEEHKLSKEKRQLFRQEEGVVKTLTAKLSAEQIKERIAEMQSREKLSKTAKKKLSAFKKMLGVMEGTNNAQESTTKELTNDDTSKTANSETGQSKKVKKQNVEEVSTEGKAVKKNNVPGGKNENGVKKGQGNKKLKQIQTVDESDKKPSPSQSANKQKFTKQKNAKVQPGNLLKVKSKEDDDEDEDDNEDESNEEEENENQIESEKEIDEDVEEEEEDEDEDEDEVEDEEEEEDEDEDEDMDVDVNEKEVGVEAEDEDENEDDDDDDDDDDDEDEDEDEDEEEENKDEDVGQKVKKVKGERKESNNDIKKQDSKKKRYVLHVSNIPYSASADEIRKHFLTKVSKVRDVRIINHPGTSNSRGFCFVELENQEDYEKALSLNQSQLKGRMIRVQYTGPNREDSKQINASKNKKLDALRKAGKLAGSQKKNNKKVKKGKQNADSSSI